MPKTPKKPTNAKAAGETQASKQKGKVVNKGGRPDYVPTPEARSYVKVLAMYGMAQLKIAEAVNVSVNTLKKHFEAELRDGANHMIAKATGSIFNLMDSKDETIKLSSSKFVLLTKGKDHGWTTKVELTLRRDLFAGLDFSRLSDIELDEMHRMFVKAGAAIEPSDLPATYVPSLPRTTHG